MEISDLNWFLYFLCVGFAGLGVFLSLRVHLFTFLDPWVLQVPEAMFAIGGLCYYCIDGVVNLESVLYVVVSFLFFAQGLRVFHSAGIDRRSYAFPPRESLFFQGNARLQSIVARSVGLPSARGTQIAIWILLALYLADAAVIFALVGVPFFRAGARTISMYSALGAGYGVLYYVYIGLSNLLPILSIKALLAHGMKKTAAISLVVTGVLTILIGHSKISIVGMLFTYGLCAHYIFTVTRLEVRITKIVYAALGVLVVILLWSFVDVVESGYEETIMRAFGRRLVNNAAGPYYYFSLESYKQMLGLNLVSYHLSQLTPYFGYIDVESRNIAANIAQQVVSDENAGFGATPSMYVIGHVAWGNLGCLYCFLIGTFMSFVRYRLRAPLVIWVCLNLMTGSLTVDGTLFLLYIVYMAVFVPLIFIAEWFSGGGAAQPDMPRHALR